MTHVIFFHTDGDPAEDEFAAALFGFSRKGDQVHRVDHGVYAPKGGPDATYLLAFQSFDLPAFVRLVQSTEWEFPTFVSGRFRPSGASLFEPIDFGMADYLERDARQASKFGWGLELPPRQRKFVEHTYPAMLNVRSERTRDSLRNPNRACWDLQSLGEVASEGEWVFECVAAYKEVRTASKSLKGKPGQETDVDGSTTDIRRVFAHAAVEGILVHLDCFLELTATGPDRRDILNRKKIGVGDRLLIDGVFRILGDGICTLSDEQYSGILVSINQSDTATGRGVR